MSILSKPFLYWNLRGLGGLRIYILGKWICHYHALYHSSSTLGLWFALRRKPLFRINDGNNLFLILQAFSIPFSLLSLLISIFTLTYWQLCYFSSLSPSRQNLQLLSAQFFTEFFTQNLPLLPVLAWLYMWQLLIKNHAF